MAQITYRANLSAKSFPFISDNWGRTVIIPQYDNTFNRSIYSTEDSDKDVGIAQIYYAHNVMPGQQGFRSVGYTTILNPSLGLTFKSIFVLKDSFGPKLYLGVTSTNTFYVNDGTIGNSWISKGVYPAGLITTAFVSGTQYIYIAGYGCIKYDFLTNAFSPVTLTGLDTSVILGITGAFGYLIAWSTPFGEAIGTLTLTIGSPVLVGLVVGDLHVGQSISGPGIPADSIVLSINPGVDVTISNNATVNGANNITFAAQSSAIAWSSTIDPTDFVPSLITGAGGGAVESAQGAITLCVPNTLGFIAYTANNAIAAIYTNNARFPFSFKEILSSGGLSSPNLIGLDANSGNHYVYTSSGFQLVSTAQAQTVFPELTDFIAGKLFEDYDETTKTFSRVTLAATMVKRINVISDRYLIISYGQTSLTHAIVYDIAQKRFGKLKIPHVATTEYQLPSTSITETPKQSIGFLQADGTLKVVDFGAYGANSSGVIALGKYQLVRARLLSLDSIAVENVYNTTTFDCQVLSALDGKNTVNFVPTKLTEGSVGTQIIYGCRAMGLNHSLVFSGNFYIESLVLQFNIHGKR